ncbi:hypothetical protein SEA_CECE_314 [Microbacterium phage Cece]|nr:hypothetical protein SEA_CECE_12 [Microbacterium phage Cece]UVG35320.1 hypothetical protein SEA_CECE_314 [Microbacterium phage Cece]
MNRENQTTAQAVRERVARLAASMPMDEDPLAEARAEARHEATLPTEDADKTPHVGMGATAIIGYGGIRRAGTVVGVKANGKTLEFRYDTVEHDRVTQTYTYTPNEDAPVREFTLRKNGAYILKGDPINWGTRLSLGIRAEYIDMMM